MPDTHPPIRRPPEDQDDSIGERPAPRNALPVPPPMQVITKGWWVLHDKQMSADELEKIEP